MYKGDQRSTSVCPVDIARRYQSESLQGGRSREGRPAVGTDKLTGLLQGAETPSKLAFRLVCLVLTLLFDPSAGRPL